MNDTFVVCGKCGRSEEYHKANIDGWLIHRRADKPEGYLIIRCPDHISEHARRVAGLSQRIHTDKIERYIETGLEVEYQPGYRAIADEGETGYRISYYKSGEDMPAFEVDTFTTVEGLAGQMATLADIRKWKILRTEE